MLRELNMISSYMKFIRTVEEIKSVRVTDSVFQHFPNADNSDEYL